MLRECVFLLLKLYDDGVCVRFLPIIRLLLDSHNEDVKFCFIYLNFNQQ
jgi:hypothetical protein